MKKWIKWFVMGLVVLAVGAGLYRGLFFNQPEDPETFQITAAPFVQVISATGRLVPVRSVQIQSQASSRLLSLPVEEGDLVAKGELIALLDDGDSRQRLSEARSSLSLAQARARSLSELGVPAIQEELNRLSLEEEQLLRTLQRQEALYAEGALPLEILEETRHQQALLNSRMRFAEVSLASRKPGGAEAAEAAAAIAQVRSHLETLEGELEKYQITAPFAGIVLERLAEPGELMQPGTVLLVLASDEGYVVEVELDERSMGLLAIGQPARLWPEAFPSREVGARVASIAPRVDAATGTVRVRLVLEEQAAFLIQDLTIQAEIEVRSLEKALLLPVAYLWQESPARVLLVSNGRVEERILPRTEFVSLNQLLVLEGLSEGEVVLDPQSGFLPGDRLPTFSAPEGGEES